MGKGELRKMSVMLTVVTSVGCASARMRVDPAVSRASRQWEVEGANPRTWGAPLGFGPYRTASVQDRTSLGWSVPLLGTMLTRDETPYAWTMSGGSGPVEAECHQVELSVRTASSVEVDLRGASGRPALACAFRVRSAEEPRTWTLALRATGSTSAGYRGTLRETSAGAEYEVSSSHDLERSRIRLGSPAGYMVSRGDDLVAMFETIGRGRVWMARSAGDQDAIAAAGIALLLFRPPE